MLTTDDCRVLDAEYSIELEGDHLALILESSSGPAGPRQARNTDYRRALTLLLARLRDLDAVIRDALVDSAFTQRRGIPEAERKLIRSPVRLADETDMEALRLQLTSAQARIGQAPGAAKGGNSSKRIRLRLDVPGYGLGDAHRLEARLATPAADDQTFYRSPEELPEGETFPEGAVRRVPVNRYERDDRARDACLAYWGTRCVVCELDFGNRYGPLGRGFIHVHHVTELSSVGPDYRVDPANELRPVCPNCHAMLHRRRPALSIEELVQLLRT
jgi:hypothetical protein